MSSVRMLVAFAVGCGGSVASVPVAPSARVAPERDAGCPLRARVVFREKRVDGSEGLLALHCDYDGPELEIGELYEWGEGGTERITIERAQADAIWEVVRDSRWRDWNSCADVEPPWWSVEIDDGSSLMQARCKGALPDAWRAIYDALDAAQPRFDDFEWPFGGDYWGDELVYYRPE